MQQEIFKNLEAIGHKFSDIEKSIGMPKNYLSRFKDPKNILPKKWIDPLLQYIEKYAVTPETTKVPEPPPIKEATPFPNPKMVVKSNGALSLTPSPEKLKAAQEAVDKINKDFGEGSIMRLGDMPRLDVDVISTGSLSLNKALGVGGLPRGRITEIFGPESSGKTTVAIHVIAEAQKNGGLCAFVDVEHAFDSSYAQKIGVDIDKLYISQPDYGEQALEEADRLILSGAYAVVVIDSVAALVPKAEMEGEHGDSKLGLQARLMSQACRKLTGTISKTNTVCIFINQLRSTIGNMYIHEVTCGGNALKYYSSVRLEVRKDSNNKIMDGEEQMGCKTKVKVVKNKVAPPFKIAYFDIFFGEGIDTFGEIIDIAIEEGVIKQSGSWFSYQNDKIGQGKAAVRQIIKDHPDMFEQIKTLISQ